jgi:hypothetical protein
MANKVSQQCHRLLDAFQFCGTEKKKKMMKKKEAEQQQQRRQSGDEQGQGRM